MRRAEVLPLVDAAVLLHSLDAVVDTSPTAGVFKSFSARSRLVVVAEIVAANELHVPFKRFLQLAPRCQLVEDAAAS